MRSDYRAAGTVAYGGPKSRNKACGESRGKHITFSGSLSTIFNYLEAGMIWHLYRVELNQGGLNELVITRYCNTKIIPAQEPMQWEH